MQESEPKPKLNANKYNLILQHNMMPTLFSKSILLTNRKSAGQKYFFFNVYSKKLKADE
mgnify:CR=1 FL=1